MKPEPKAQRQARQDKSAPWTNPKQVGATHAPLKRVGRSVTDPESPDPRTRMEGENGTPQRDQNGSHAEKKH